MSVRGGGAVKLQGRGRSYSTEATMKPLARVIFVFFLFSAFNGFAIPTVSGPVLRGVAPEDLKIYDSRGVISCRDGSKKFTMDQLNDDFCDCLDATDEPGTSACPNGKFYCRNAGHIPLIIFSSRVNDGICDCCDGSDEYGGKVNCTNTCWEAGKVSRKKLMKKIESYKEGMLVRKQEITEARLALAKDEAELLKLKHGEKILAGLVQQLKNRKEQIEKAEEKERLQKEKEKEKKEAEEKSALEISETEKKFDPEKSEADEKNEQQEDKTMKSTDDDRIGLLEDSFMDQGVAGHPGGSSVEAEHGDHSGSEVSFQSSSNQDESKDAGLLEENTVKDGTLEESDHKGHEVTPEETQDEEDDAYASEADDDHSYNDDGDADDTEDHTRDDADDTEDHTQDREEDHDYSSSYMSDSENDFVSSEITFSRNQTWLEKIQRTVRTVLQAINLFQTPVDKSEAAIVRKEYDESSAKLSKMQSRISSLTEKLKNDFGPEKEFYLFYGRCFESKQNKYVYKVCPFKQASQVEGHSTTQLGNWEKFEDAYKIMVFTNGYGCWNGPDRSLKVKLRCGLQNELTDVDEPSRCEYVASLSTPVVCREEKVKELEQKLDELNRQAPQGHDEL